MAVVRRLTAALVLLALLAGCASSPGGGSRAPALPSSKPSILGPAPTALIKPDDRYVMAVDKAADLGLAVWLESDLIGRWLEGIGPFLQAAGRLRALAARPGVVGVKVADELGTDDGFGEDQVLRFLGDVRLALGPSVPVLVDVSLPELGCAPGDAKVSAASEACRVEARSRYPGAALAVVDEVVSRRLVAALDVSTSLQSPTRYASWGINRDRAQRDAWQEVARRGWSKQVVLGARKAMAVPDPYRTAKQAAADLPLFVDVPRGMGVAAVDVWTWRQHYQGRTVGLVPGRDELWSGLVKRRAEGAVLMTHFTPSQVYTSVASDLELLATVFRGVFIAAGTG
jgi:hypothetical protein